LDIRRRDGQISGGTAIGGGGDAATPVQAPMETDVAGDGFHWRKYGQKVVKGNPYPRYITSTLPHTVFCTSHKS
jgi:WRKY DNA -binding domain